DEQPAVPSREREVRLRVGEREIQLKTDRGVFSPERIDPGTRLLLELAPGPPGRGEILDLGCGYGPIAIALAIAAPEARVWAVDVNQRALELARENAREAGAGGVVAGTPDDVPGSVR